MMCIQCVVRCHRFVWGGGRGGGGGGGGEGVNHHALYDGLLWFEKQTFFCIHRQVVGAGQWDDDGRCAQR